MDFIGDIVEHEVEAPTLPVQREISGFPKRNKEKKESRWKQRQQAVKKVEPLKKPLSEAEKIHNENMEKISRMTEGEIESEREELLQSLNPNLVKSLLARVEKRQNKIESHDHVHAEGCEHDGWIGGDREGKLSLPALDSHDVDVALGVKALDIGKEEEEAELVGTGNSKNPNAKAVRFNDIATVKYEDLDENVELNPNDWEDIDDINDLVSSTPGLDDIAESGYQLVADEDDEEPAESVHFPKPKSEDLDLDDPEFFDKLHEKYYPDLPKETSKLSWMTTPMPTTKTTTYESISDMRFDFKGNLVELEDEEGKKSNDTPTYAGLHHHSENPHLAGYTLPELAHLARSVVPSQRCVAIQTLGRILHKLGMHKFSIFPGKSESSEPNSPEFDESVKEVADQFEEMFWDLIEKLRIIESLTEAADESKTRNLSVRNYAIEALWLWKQGNPEAQAQPDSKDIEI